MMQMLGRAGRPRFDEKGEGTFDFRTVFLLGLYIQDAGGPAKSLGLPLGDHFFEELNIGEFGPEHKTNLTYSSDLK